MEPARRVLEGKAEVETAYKEFLKDFKAGSLKHQCPDTSGGHDGNIAWLVASCNMQDTTPDGKTRSMRSMSRGAQEGERGWKFQTLHFSNLTGSDAPRRQALLRRPRRRGPKKAQ